MVELFTHVVAALSFLVFVSFLYTREISFDFWDSIKSLQDKEKTFSYLVPHKIACIVKYLI